MKVINISDKRDFYW